MIDNELEGDICEDKHKRKLKSILRQVPVNGESGEHKETDEELKGKYVIHVMNSMKFVIPLHFIS